jgi:hypothetical protein
MFRLAQHRCGKKDSQNFPGIFSSLCAGGRGGTQMSTSALVGMARRGGGPAWKSLAATRGQQVLSLLLTSIPLAERMLLYHVALTACIMLPERGLFEKTLISCFARLGVSR